MTQDLVELALPDGPLYVSEQSDAYVTKLGGRPCWPAGFDKSQLPELKCSACGSDLFLVLQMDCPWPGEEKAFNRIMYVLGCNSRLCTEGHGEKAWRVFVIQRACASSMTAEKPVTQKTTGLWDTIMSEPVAKVAEGLKEMALDEESEEEMGLYEECYPVGFPATRLHIVEEMIQERAKKCEPTNLEIPAAFRAAEGESWDGEAYENSRPAGYDKVFEKFQQRVSSYPRQCVRYSPTSQPLMFYRDDEIGSKSVANCQKCGKQRQFELQLMPAILSLLPTCEGKHLRHIPEGKRNSHPLFGDGMEWATVIVYSCGTCLGQTGLIEASVQVQIEKE